VEVKVETFPFTKYGTVPGTVTWVSRDAVIEFLLSPIARRVDESLVER
jgi:hypothetical protein